MYEDNQSCLKILQEDKINPRSKHIDVKYYFVRDLQKFRIAEVVHLRELFFRDLRVQSPRYF